MGNGTVIGVTNGNSIRGLGYSATTTDFGTGADLAGKSVPTKVFTKNNASTHLEGAALSSDPQKSGMVADLSDGICGIIKY